MLKLYKIEGQTKETNCSSYKMAFQRERKKFPKLQLQYIGYKQTFATEGMIIRCLSRDLLNFEIKMSINCHFNLK